jgi:ABC-type Na+ efflux pump permease subunit
MLKRLIWIETRRLVTQLRFGLALLIMLGLSIYSVREQLSPTLTNRAHVQGALSQVADDWLPLTIPLVAGIVAAGSFAEDRRRGYVPLVLARGISRREYLGAKVTAMALSSALAMFVGCMLFFVVALALPAGRTPFDGGSGVDAAGNSIVLPPSHYYPGPAPNLYGYSPILNDLLAVAMAMVATAGLALAGLLAGALVANEYGAAAAPFFITIVSLFALLNRADIISPFTYLDIWFWYRRQFPESMLGYAAFVYWLIFGALVVVIAGGIFLRRELD